ncbi:hypothetical protein INN71_08220 [Nocardioides sp. ChNu-153]|uniref:hypothetical protein n=1 Tax=unclassified Nocardioides TaxID=2615069 RepID=UPI002405AC0D|nr:MULTISPECIES: hypothetical protein [unclassified Nocardioides]MDF9717327.1 hypothetical protein [Nocardioides sp. ChNu-99]MDN7121376.1 hypothetical protein [Nocardioides sp. ChNu-153]
MADSDAFDAFYKDARDRLLAQTYLLTGDLPAARSAVREAFVAAWHRWSKVAASGDPEAEVRPRTWAQAQRRATTRPWHREKGLAPEVTATLEALAALDGAPRRLLLLSELADLALGDAAREAGVTLEEGARHLAVGRAEYAEALGLVTPEEVTATLGVAAAAATADARWPRPSILRRAGSRRRRTHAVVGAALAVVAVGASGFVVHDETGTPTSLARSVDRDIPVPGSPPTLTSPELADSLTVDTLLPTADVEVLGPDLTWTTTTTDNTPGDGLVLPCQEARYADTDGLAGFVRTFRATTTDGRLLQAFQASELSRSAEAAGGAYGEWASWLAGCSIPRTQLVATYAVEGVGDEAVAFVLRRSGEEAGIVTAGVARTGDITTVTVADVAGAEEDAGPTVANLLATGVNRICETEGGGECASDPALVPRLPLPVGDDPYLLDVVDLPPVPGVELPWSGTRPAAPTTGTESATVCDNANFVNAGIASPVTRTFLITDAGLPDTFGLSQSTGTFADAQVAQGFVGAIEGLVADCQEKDLVTGAELIGDETYDDGRLLVWSIDVRVGEDSTVRMLMGVARAGALVTQVNLVPAGDATLEDEEFVAVVDRARQRLAQVNASAAAAPADPATTAAPSAPAEPAAPATPAPSEG